MHIDPVRATEPCPSLVPQGRAVCRLCDLNGRKSRLRVFRAIEKRVHRRRGAASPRGYCLVAQTTSLRDVLDGIALLRRSSIDHGKATRTIT